jgi:hypothetical protein
VHAQDIVKAMRSDTKLAHVTAISCEFAGNYEMGMLASDANGSGRVMTIIGMPGPS